MNTAPTILAAALAAISIPLLLSCTGSSETEVDPIDPDVFVAVMASLSQVHEDREAQADSIREEILRDHGVTAEQLLAFAGKAGRDPARMGVLAGQIAEASDSIAVVRGPLEPVTPEEVATPETRPPQTRPEVARAVDDESRRTRLDSLRRRFRREQP